MVRKCIGKTLFGLHHNQPFFFALNPLLVLKISVPLLAMTQRQAFFVHSRKTQGKKTWRIQQLEEKEAQNQTEMSTDLQEIFFFKELVTKASAQCKGQRSMY